MQKILMRFSRFRREFLSDIKKKEEEEGRKKEDQVEKVPCLSYCFSLISGSN